MKNAEYDWKRFDRIWDRRGHKAAVLSLPIKPAIMKQEPASKDTQCQVCGTLPQVSILSPHRQRRSFKAWVKRDMPVARLYAEWLEPCECWVPQKLDYR